MPSERVERRLAAILVADMVGYSRLMEADELGTIARHKAHRQELIVPKITQYKGRIVKTTGDGLLAEFASAVDATECAVAIQQEMAQREQQCSEDTRIRYRVGINVGDIIVDDNDIYGSGINVATRIEGLAEPGGICISDDAYRQVKNMLSLSFRYLGTRSVKNLAEPIKVHKIELEGLPNSIEGNEISLQLPQQEVRFCSAHDGVGLAYAIAGHGFPIVKTANWMSHIEYDWHSPIWRHLLLALVSNHRLVRYDQRGNGLSDWEVNDFSFEAIVSDLETVVDAAGLNRFALVGLSQGCAVSAAYAARHPERVSRMILYGGYTRGWKRRGTKDKVEQEEAMLALARHGWGQDNPAFRQVFTSLFAPDATAEQMQWYNELQRISTSGDNVVRIDHAFGDIDVSDLLANVVTPTLVLHCRDDSVTPFSEGRRFAKLLPNSNFVALEGRNHLLLETEPAWRRFLSEIQRFIKDLD